MKNLMSSALVLSVLASANVAFAAEGCAPKDFGLSEKVQEYRGEITYKKGKSHPRAQGQFCYVQLVKKDLDAQLVAISWDADADDWGIVTGYTSEGNIHARRNSTIITTVYGEKTVLTCNGSELVSASDSKLYECSNLKKIYGGDTVQDYL